MRTIRSQLLRTFALIIGVMTGFIVLLGIGHRAVIRQYDAIASSVFAQYNIITSTEELAIAFNTFRNVGTDERYAEYLTVRTRLTALLDDVERSDLTENVRVAFDGVLNTVQAVIADTDTGVQAYRTGDIAGTSQWYTDATSKLVFVRDSTAALILRQLEYAQILRENAAVIERNSFLIGVAMVLALLAVCIALAASYAKTFSYPLTALTDVSTRTAAGDYDVKIDRHLLIAQDEFGGLARAFDAMLTSLRQNLRTVETASKSRDEAAADLERQNHTLQKLNQLFVQREARIKELQEELERLRGAHQS